VSRLIWVIGMIDLLVHPETSSVLVSKGIYPPVAGGLQIEV
jgi:hypothetical protein